jgi:hypothetical protein
VPAATAYFPSLGGGATRAPHEQTMLRVAHSIFSRRPHAAQPVYVPGRRGARATRAEAGRAGPFMGDLRSSLRPGIAEGQTRGADRSP